MPEAAAEPIPTAEPRAAPAAPAAHPAGPPETAGEVERYYRRNFAANVGDGAFWQLGISFISVQAILPVFVSRLTTSDLLIGLIPAIMEVGWYLPQLFVAPLVTRLKRVRPMVVWLGVAERLPMLLLGAGTLLLRDSPAAVLLAVFFGLHVARSLVSGTVANAWTELMARIIPARRRGLFFGVMAALGGLLSLAGSAGARAILAGYPFPANFALCFVVGFGMASLGWLCLSATVEPATAPSQAPRGRDYWRSLGAILRQDRNFRRYVISRMTFGLSSMAPGFLAVSAVQRFALGDEQAAVFSALLFGAGVVANLAWGWLGDRLGHKLTLELSGGLLLVSLGCALAAPSVWFYYAAFAALGAANAGNVLATVAIVMEFAPPERRPVYIGLAGTLRAPVAGLAPLLGGWLAGAFGYQALFAVAMVPVGLAVAMTRLLVTEPRQAEGK
jgi:MFS family permease